MVVPRPRLFPIQLELGVGVYSRFREGEPRGHDTDDGGRLVVQIDGATQNGAIASELRLPRGVAQERHRCRARAVLIGGEGATQEGLHAEKGEETGGGRHYKEALRRQRISERHFGVAVTGDS